MSTWVIGLRTTNDPTYKKHLAVLEACRAAEIEELPAETAKYFGSSDGYKGLEEEVLQVKIPTTDYREDMSEGYEVKVADIPQGVEIIRFVNSY